MIVRCISGMIIRLIERFGDSVGEGEAAPPVASLKGSDFFYPILIIVVCIIFILIAFAHKKRPIGYFYSMLAFSVAAIAIIVAGLNAI